MWNNISGLKSPKTHFLIFIYKLKIKIKIWQTFKLANIIDLVFL